MATRWVSLRRAATILGVGNRAAKTIVLAAQVRARQYPGRPPEYALDDLEQLAREAERPRPEQPPISLPRSAVAHAPVFPFGAHAPAGFDMPDEQEGGVVVASK